jgi:hypothetical protein
MALIGLGWAIILCCMSFRPVLKVRLQRTQRHGRLGTGR